MKNNNTYRVYIVEDDSMLADEISLLLERWGYEVQIVQDFGNIMNEVAAWQPHVIMMDVNIPAFDGFYWCRKIRELSAVPVIYLSSRDSNMDIIMGMSSGGDDYLVKPFDNDVLIARLQAVIRRTYEYSFASARTMECRGLVVELDTGKAKYRDESCELTKNELKILSLLIENRGKIVSRESLMRQLWDDEIYVNENTLTVNVNRVRQKLEDLGLLSLITTKKGMGYQIL